MADSGNNQVGFGFEIEDNASQILGDIESAYISLSKSQEAFYGSLKKAMKGQTEATEDAAEAAEDVGEATEKNTGKLGEATEALKENWLGVDKLGISWGKLVKVLAAISIGAIIAGIGAFFYKAFKKAEEFNSEIAKLNETFAMTAKQSAIVGSTILSLQNRAGRTREEVIQLTKKLLDLGLIPSMAKKAGGSFQQLARDTLDLSSATGISIDSAAEFADQLIRINRLPATSIRNIGLALKTVADNAKITSDELISFNKGLEPLLSILSDQSKEATEEYTKNMMGIAGALSEVNIDAGKITSSFADMLDITSESGREALSKLALATNISTTSLEKMIETDPTAIFDRLAKRAASLNKDQLQIMGRNLDSIGLGFSDLTRLGREYGEVGKKSFSQVTSELLKTQKGQDSLAGMAEKRQTALNSLSQRFAKLWDTLLIKIGDKLLPVLEKRLFPILEKIADKIDPDAIADSFERMFTWVVKNKNTLVFIGKALLGALATVKIILPLYKLFSATTGEITTALGIIKGGVGKLPSLSVIYKSVAEDVVSAGKLLRSNLDSLRIGAKLAFDSFKGKAGLIGGVVAAGAAGYALGTGLRKLFPEIDSFTQNLMSAGAKIFGLTGIIGGGEASKAGIERALATSEYAQKSFQTLIKAVSNKDRGSLEFAKAAVFLKNMGKEDLSAYAELLSKQTGISKGTVEARLEGIGQSGLGVQDVASRRISTPEIARNPGVSFPGSMTTDSPTQEALLRENNANQKELINVMKGRGGGVSALDQARMSLVGG